MIHDCLSMEVMGFLLFGWGLFGLVFLQLVHPSKKKKTSLCSVCHDIKNRVAA